MNTLSEVIARRPLCEEPITEAIETHLDNAGSQEGSTIQLDYSDIVKTV